VVVFFEDERGNACTVTSERYAWRAS
jgi:hypothetical protein